MDESYSTRAAESVAEVRASIPTEGRIPRDSRHLHLDARAQIAAKNGHLAYDRTRDDCCVALERSMKQAENDILKLRKGEEILTNLSAMDTDLGRRAVEIQRESLQKKYQEIVDVCAGALIQCAGLSKHAEIHGSVIGVKVSTSTAGVAVKTTTPMTAAPAAPSAMAVAMAAAATPAAPIREVAPVKTRKRRVAKVEK